MTANRETDTILAGLLADAEELRTRQVALPVPGRKPGRELVLHCTAPTDGEALKRQERAAKAAHKDTHEIYFNRAVVATYTDWIETSDGDPLMLDGEQVNFKDQALQEALGASSASDAVARLLVSDGVIGRLAGMLSNEFIGRTDDDPTQD